MAYITWSDLFSVGVPAFDEEHRGLVEVINRFHDAGADPAAIFEILNALVRYAEEHFVHEQVAMDRCHYPERLKHKLEHDRFLEEIFRLNERLAAGEAMVSDDVGEFLKNWLLNHILNTDRRYAPFFAGHSLD